MGSVLSKLFSWLNLNHPPTNIKLPQYSHRSIMATELTGFAALKPAFVVKINVDVTKIHPFGMWC